MKGLLFLVSIYLLIAMYAIWDKLNGYFKEMGVFNQIVYYVILVVISFVLVVHIINLIKKKELILRNYPYIKRSLGLY